jgi:copper transport protein
MRRLLLFAVAAVVAVFVGGPTPASSHALLIRAEPPANSQVREPPAVLTLHFSEPLERKFSGARVTNQDGERVDDRIEFDDNDRAVMRIYLNDVEPGYLSVFWENVSAVDGHRITGTYPLTILLPDGRLPAGSAPTAQADTQGEEPDPLRVATRFVLLVAGSLLTGALVFLLVVTPGITSDGSERLRAGFERLALGVATGSVAVMGLFGLFEILLQASELSVGVGDVFDTQWGERWLWRNLLLLPALLLTGVGLLTGARRFLTGAALIAALAYLAVTASVSHSAAGAGAFWAAGSDFIHLVAASVWIGMLALVVLLFVRVRREMPEGERFPVLVTALRSFSSVAVISVALLLFTGTFNTIIEVSRFSDLFNSNYGNALLAKLVVLVPLLFIGAANAYLFRPDLESELEANNGGRESRERLAQAETTLNRTVRWETGLLILVLAIVALLVQLTPTRGRLSSGESQGIFLDSMEQNNIAVTLQIDPRQPGTNTFEVYLAGDIESVESVRLNFRPNGDADQESRLLLDPSNPPTFFVGQGANLGQAGEWQVQVFVRRAAGTGADLTLPFELTVPPPGGAAAAVKRGGAFALPVTFGVASVALLTLSGVASAGVVFISLRRPGLPGGYGTLIAEQVSDRMPELRPAWSLGVLVVLGIGLGLIVGAHRHSNPEPRAGNPVEPTQESIVRGQMLFSQNCIQCHGESGRGDGPLANSLPIKPANLYDHVPYHPDQFFFNVISNGVGGIMPAFKNSISEEDRWNILNYLRATFVEEPLTQ